MHAGFDTFGYPGDEAMDWLRQNTNFEWCGFYLAPAPSHGNTSWMPMRDRLTKTKWGLAPLYVGQETIGPGAHHVDRLQGTVDGEQAAELMARARFPRNSCVYLDLENGLPFPTPEHDYVKAWVAAVERTGFRAGVYCSYTFAEQVHHLVPSAEIWAFHIHTASLHRAPGPNYPNLHPAASGYSGAALWQCAQNCVISCPPIGHTRSLTVDLDTSVWADPSMPDELVS